MKFLTRAVVDEFSKDIDISAFQNAYSLICQHLEQVITSIKQHNPYITDCNIYVANEVFSGTEFFASGLDLFIVFDAVQIELNQKNKPTNKVKKGLQYFFKEFKNNFNIFSSKKKKKERQLKETEQKILSLKNYDVEILMNDLMLNLTKVLYNKTSLQLFGNKISIIGEEEFGIDINLYPVFSTGDDIYNMYNISSQKNIQIDFADRFDNIEIKNIKTNNQFHKQIKVFNNLYWNYVKQKPNQIFIESLLFSCPDELFINDVVDTTNNLINYLKNSAMQNLTSICDENKKLFDEPLNITPRDIAVKFINNVNIV